MLKVEDAWESFCDGDYKDISCESPKKKCAAEPPKCSDIYISTKTTISFLNREIPLSETFWKVPIIPYHVPRIGVIKKQMKFNSSSEDELQDTISKLDVSVFHEQHVLSRIVKDEGRITYRDIRKISIGLCKKDITSYRCKKKGAFYNCFALILRIEHAGAFKEIHVKVFNTGKLEIPGIQTDDVLIKTLELLCDTLGKSPVGIDGLTWDKTKNLTVLINSNFACGYYINREKLFHRLKYHYGINSAFDPCSYPGIQCEFYYNEKTELQDGKQPATILTENEKKCYVRMSFMIFRTGSVLIVGKCSEFILHNIYKFLKELLESEFENVGVKVVEKGDIMPSSKPKKLRKKTVVFNVI
jgi:hypothetical protein